MNIQRNQVQAAGTGRSEEKVAQFVSDLRVDLFDLRGQVVAGLSTVAAVFVISLRRERIATLEVAW